MSLPHATMLRMPFQHIYRLVNFILNYTASAYYLFKPFLLHATHKILYIFSYNYHFLTKLNNVVAFCRKRLANVMNMHAANPRSMLKNFVTQRNAENRWWNFNLLLWLIKISLQPKMICLLLLAAYDFAVIVLFYVPPTHAINATPAKISSKIQNHKFATSTHTLMQTYSINSTLLFLRLLCNVRMSNQLIYYAWRLFFSYMLLPIRRYVHLYLRHM